MALNTSKCNYLTPVHSKGLRGERKGSLSSVKQESKQRTNLFTSLLHYIVRYALKNNFRLYLSVQCGYMQNKVISKLFQRIVAAHEYFPTCSMSLK